MDVTGLGTLAMDVLMKVDTLPGEDGFCVVESTAYEPGGSGTNVIVQLARLSARCSYIGAVSDDGLGSDILKSLEEEKVDISNMVVIPGKVTLHTNIVIDRQGSKFIMLNMGDAFDKLTAEAVNRELIQKSKVFYTDLLPFAPAKEGLMAAKEGNTPAVFNMQVGLGTFRGFSVAREDVLDILQYVDVFAPCRDGLYDITGTRDLKKCCKILRRYHKGILLFTLGKEGSVAFDENNREIFVPAKEITPVDTTGAGDSYIGGFIYQYYIKGDTLKASMEFASKCAAYTCSGLGARHSPGLEHV